MNKWMEYEREKSKLKELFLTEEEYEKLIKEIVEKLEL